MSHPWHDLSPGDDVPKEFNAVIEIPLHSSDNYTMLPSIQPINPTRIAAAFDHKDQVFERQLASRLSPTKQQLTTKARHARPALAMRRSTAENGIRRRGS